MAPHDLPDFVRSSVDGYAVVAADTFGAGAGLPAYLDVVGEAAMGQRSAITLRSGQAALVHTGGMVPDGADAVVMLEYTSRAGEPRSARRRTRLSRLQHRGVPPGGGRGELHPGRRGRPRRRLVIPAGRTLRPQELGGLLALGVTKVQVARRPRVAILSQGDEVVPPDQEPGPGQVRDINSYTLAGFVRRAGGLPLKSP